MQRGLGIQVHRAENPAEPEKVLILNPGGTAALVHLDAKPVARFLQVWGQVKVGRGKAILRIADKMPVKPDEKHLLHPLEADTDRFPAQPGFQVEGAGIAADRRVVPVDFGRAQFSVAVPRIERVDILDLPVPLQLDMPRHLYRAECGIIRVFTPEIGGAGSGVLAPAETPQPVQALPQGGYAARGFLRRGIAHMVGMCIQPVYLKHSGVGQPLKFSLHNENSLISYSLTAPAATPDRIYLWKKI